MSWLRGIFSFVLLLNCYQDLIKNSVPSIKPRDFTDVPDLKFLRS